jgi:single-strand DNA-binding protein
MNTIHLISRCGSDPEVKSFDWGKVAKFSLATSDSFKNKEGEKVTQTDWHNCVFRGVVCDALSQYVHKGDQIAVTGKVKYRSYEKDGDTKYITEVICDHFEFCGGSKKEEKPEPKEEKWQGKKEAKSMSDASQLPGNIDDGSVPDDLSDLPF